jgi:hypothetical protein
VTIAILMDAQTRCVIVEAGEADASKGWLDSKFYQNLIRIHHNSTSLNVNVAELRYEWRNRSFLNQ